MTDTLLRLSAAEAAMIASALNGLATPAAKSLALGIESGVRAPTFAEVAGILGAEQAAKQPHLSAYAAAVETREGKLEVDDLAIVSKGNDPGAYVMAWVWVSDDEAGIHTH